MRLQTRASGRYLDNTNLHHHHTRDSSARPALAISRAAELRARVCRGAVSARRHLHRHGGRGLHVLLPRRLHGRHVSGGRGRVRDQQPVREGELLQHGEIRNSAITSDHHTSLSVSAHHLVPPSLYLVKSSLFSKLSSSPPFASDPKCQLLAHGYFVTQLSLGLLPEISLAESQFSRITKPALSTGGGCGGGGSVLCDWDQQQ